jgi:rhamnosyltransferase subunit B
MVAPQLPLAAILPNARAFVHHGGIGSLAQGFCHAIPQLVLASAYDQFENGARLESIGAGRWRRTDRVKPMQVAADLRALVEPEAAMDFIRRRPSPAAVETICDHLLALT